MSEPPPKYSAGSSALPVHRYRDEIIEHFRTHDALILSSSVGSGKSTQIPRFIYEDLLAATGGRIAVSQPRRIAAVSVAYRVAKEMGVPMGGVVGYAVRFDEKASASTGITFMTDGMLLTRFISSSAQCDYDFVVIDEAHERSLAGDLVMGFLRMLLAHRRHPKVLIMSATANVELFSRFFYDCRTISVPGVLHPLTVKYLEDFASAQALASFQAVAEDLSSQPSTWYVDTAVQLIASLHKRLSADKGVLCFLTGADDIAEAAARLGDALVRDLALEAVTVQSGGDYVILPLYSSLPRKLQDLVFKPYPGKRKIVIATNVAETSLTIPGIHCVVDCGLLKEMSFNAASGVQHLDRKFVSQSMAVQRAGRAGRLGPGCVFRLYTKSVYNRLPSDAPPEILRQSLEGMVLTLLAHGRPLTFLQGFPFISPPPFAGLASALDRLHALQAINEDGCLTSVGALMSIFPVAYVSARSIAEAILLHVGEGKSLYAEVCAIVAMTEVFATSLSMGDLARVAGLRADPDSDHITLLAVFDGFVSAKCRVDWCGENSLDFKMLENALHIYSQLIRLCKRAIDNREGLWSADKTTQERSVFHRLLCSPSASKEDILRRMLAVSHRTHAAALTETGCYHILCSAQKVDLSVHASSLAATKAHKYVIYHSLVRVKREEMRIVTSISKSDSYPASHGEAHLLSKVPSNALHP